MCEGANRGHSILRCKFLILNMDDKLNPSELGTFKYWENAYHAELENFTDHGDVGEVWFGELISEKIINWIVDNPKISKNDNIIDLGCGNGMLLIELCKMGYTNLHGIDYSKNAIDLALKISQKENMSIKFTVNNVLEDSIPSVYDLALDKGTFDAISLDPDDSVSKRKIYVENVSKLLKKDGIFLITSCNWTEEELKQQFNSCFQCIETLPTPSFTFGGLKGHTVTSVVLQKL